MKKQIESELKYLITLAGTSDFDKELDNIYTRYKDNTEAIAMVQNFLVKGVKASVERIDILTIKAQFAEISEVVNLSYIAKKYFNKSRAWLSQRINEHQVNGKPASFTEEEIKTLNFAFQDIGKKIGSFSIL